MDNVPCHSCFPCLGWAFQRDDDGIRELYTMDGKPRLLDQVRDQIRLKHYPIRTERVYCEWNKLYVRFQNYKHPLEMGLRKSKFFFLTLRFAATFLLLRRTKRLLRCCFFISRCSNRIHPGLARWCAPRNPRTCRSCCLFKKCRRPSACLRVRSALSLNSCMEPGFA